MVVMDTAPIRVLLVDDEAGFAEVLQKRLGKRGMEISIATSGTEAIQTLRAYDFDVAILDLKMEDMDGIEILQIFKKMVPDMSVVMLTGHGSEKAAREGLAYGAFDYLLKPCELEDLIDTVHQAINR